MPISFRPLPRWCAATWKVRGDCLPALRRGIRPGQPAGRHHGPARVHLPPAELRHQRRYRRLRPELLPGRFPGDHRRQPADGARTAGLRRIRARVRELHGRHGLPLGQAAPHRVPPPAGRRRCKGSRPHRGVLLLHLPRHRIALGQAHVGHLVGVGCAADLHVRAVPAVPGLHGRLAGH